MRRLSLLLLLAGCPEPPGAQVAGQFDAPLLTMVDLYPDVNLATLGDVGAVPSGDGSLHVFAGGVYTTVSAPEAQRPWSVWFESTDDGRTWSQRTEVPPGLEGRTLDAMAGRGATTSGFIMSTAAGSYAYDGTTLSPVSAGNGCLADASGEVSVVGGLCGWGPVELLTTFPAATVMADGTPQAVSTPQAGGAVPQGFNSRDVGVAVRADGGVHVLGRHLLKDPSRPGARLDDDPLEAHTYRIVDVAPDGTSTPSTWDLRPAWNALTGEYAEWLDTEGRIEVFHWDGAMHFAGAFRSSTGRYGVLYARHDGTAWGDASLLELRDGVVRVALSRGVDHAFLVMRTSPFGRTGDNVPPVGLTTSSHWTYEITGEGLGPRVHRPALDALGAWVDVQARNLLPIDDDRVAAPVWASAMANGYLEPGFFPGVIDLSPRAEESGLLAQGVHAFSPRHLLVTFDHPIDPETVGTITVQGHDVLDATVLSGIEGAVEVRTAGRAAGACVVDVSGVRSTSGLAPDVQTLTGPCTPDEARFDLSPRVLGSIRASAWHMAADGAVHMAHAGAVSRLSSDRRSVANPALDNGGGQWDAERVIWHEGTFWGFGGTQGVVVWDADVADWVSAETSNQDSPPGTVFQASQWGWTRDRAVDGDGTLWVALDRTTDRTQGFIYRLVDNTWEEVVPFGQLGQPPGVGSFAVGPDGTLWAAQRFLDNTSAAVWSFDGTEWSEHAFGIGGGYGIPTDLVVDDGDVATFRIETLVGTIRVVQVEDGVLTEIGLPTNTSDIVQMRLGPDGHVWASTLGFNQVSGLLWRVEGGAWVQVDIPRRRLEGGETTTGIPDFWFDPDGNLWLSEFFDATGQDPMHGVSMVPGSLLP